jgi:hypothetical protein
MARRHANIRVEVDVSRAEAGGYRVDVFQAINKSGGGSRSIRRISSQYFQTEGEANKAYDLIVKRAKRHASLGVEGTAYEARMPSNVRLVVR